MLTSIRGRLSVRTFAGLPKAWIVAGRTLLLLNVLALALSPITERVWAWDKFLRGRQDFELSLSAILAFCSFALVFVQRFRRATASFFQIKRIFLRTQDCCRKHLLFLFYTYTTLNRKRFTAPVFGTYGIPLQI